MNWLTCVANSENVIAHIDSVLKNIQQVSEEMDNADLIFTIDGLVMI